MEKEFYIYGASFASIAPGVSQTKTLQIQADSHFEIMKLCFASDVAAAVQTDATRSIPKCSLVILDTGSGRQFMSEGIDIATFFGDGQNPFILPVPKIFRANTAINLALTNYSATETYNIRLSFIGAKIYGQR